MNDLIIFSRCAAAGIVVLLLIFEFSAGRAGRGAPANVGYTYYVPDGSCVRIRHIAGTLYRVYADDSACPLSLRRDRFGGYFTVTAGSAQEAERAIDELYQEV